MQASLILSAIFIFKLSVASANVGSPTVIYSTQKDLQRRNLKMTWPKGLNPAFKADIFNHNQLKMEQSCNVIYSWLSAPQDWPTWLIFVRDINLAKPNVPLSVGSQFKWTIFGFPINAEVFVAEPGRKFGYTVTPPGPPPKYAQSWLLEADGKGCLVTTEEVGIGEMALKASKSGDPLVHLAHELWLASLRLVSRTGARPSK